MKTAKYYIIDAKLLEEWNEFKTLPLADVAANEIKDAKLYEPVIVKVVTLKVKEPSVS